MQRPPLSGGVDNTLRRPTHRTAVTLSRVWGKVQDGSTLILEVPEFPHSTVYDRSKEALMPKAAGFVQPFPYNSYLQRTNRDTSCGKKTHILPFDDPTKSCICTRSRQKARVLLLHQVRCFAFKSDCYFYASFFRSSFHRKAAGRLVTDACVHPAARIRCIARHRHSIHRASLAPFSLLRRL